MVRNFIVILIVFLSFSHQELRGEVLTEKDFNALQPFLLTDNHPAKKTLDTIFNQFRVIYDDASLVDAGFRILFNQPRSFIRVIKHPKLHGLLIKANLDTDLRQKRKKPSWRWFLKRCIGANNIAFIIKTYNIRYFCVPKKWIYVLPQPLEQVDNTAIDPKPVLLVVQDMQLVSQRENTRAWKRKITKRHLRELYTIMRLAGGSSYRSRNICFTKQGKFAFIDTEYPDRKPNYASINSYLNKRMRKYWRKLTGQVS